MFILRKGCGDRKEGIKESNEAQRAYKGNEKGRRE